MSLKERLAAKASSVRTDDLDDMPTPAKYEARTAPGQLMGLQARVANLEKELAEARASGRQAVLLADLHEVAGRRRKLTQEQFNELKANLARNDLITPITVRQREAGGYEIVSGHNRVAAYRELGRTEIEAVVRTLDEERTIVGAFYANLLQPSLPDYEKYLGFRLIRERNPELSQAQIGEMAGVSQSLLSKLLGFDGLPEEAHQILREQPDVLGAAAAVSLANLARRGKQARVVEALRQVANATMDQSAAVAFAAQDSDPDKRTKPAVEIKTFRVGKAQLCSYRKTDTTLRVDFKNAEHAAAVHAELEKVLEAYAARLKNE